MIARLSIARQQSQGMQSEKPAPAPVDATWERSYQPDPIVMFRFSALTFNASRIHYDYKYVTETEGYPGLNRECQADYQLTYGALSQ